MKYILILFLLSALSCSSMQPKSVDDSYTQHPAPATFPMDYKGEPPTLPTETWAEFYGAGTYLYQQGKYDKAMEYFLSAANLATGEAKRTCLVAAAISSLAAADPTQFINIRQEIRNLSNDDPFKKPTATDKALEALDKIERY
jgi:hypothetical protein